MKIVIYKAHMAKSTGQLGQSLIALNTIIPSPPARPKATGKGVNLRWGIRGPCMHTIVILSAILELGFVQPLTKQNVVFKT